MRHLAGVAVVAALIAVAGCSNGMGAAASHRSPGLTSALMAPAPPSVAAQGCSTWQTGSGPAFALVHVQTLLDVSHARGPQEGAHGQVTVASMDIAFLAGGAPAGWAIQATPPGPAGQVLGNGKSLVTATTYRIYLSGRWTPDCRVMRVYWVPGAHR